MKLSRVIPIVLALAVACGAVYAAFQALRPQPALLASFAPQGALLAIESPDFSGLLKSWTTSQEEQRWLASDNYASFSRSRLFTRLQEAQDQFAASAGLPPDSQFLQQVAGKQSLFAWYDIGNLEFLYITRMAPGEAAKTPLLQLQSKFQERKAGDAAFYVRTQGDPSRTVAFAVHGDLLLLATREDLLATALQLMQQPQDATLLHEAWYAAAASAAAKQPGDLRMTLNMARIVPSPYFRSYWVQQNISELKQYSAALSDLYRTQENFREERVLVPKQEGETAAQIDLAPLLRYLPPTAGVYRATAQPKTDQIIAQMEDKLLAHNAGAYRNEHAAPVVDLSTPVAGDVTNLDVRIDEPVVSAQPRAVALAPLHTLLEAANPEAMLVYSSTNITTTENMDSLFLPMHSAVLLAVAGDWNADLLQQSILTALAPRITVGASGIDWKQQHQGETAWYELSGIQPFAFAVQGKICILATDAATLKESLDVAHGAPIAPRVASTIAGFHHLSEREHFIRLAKLLDHPAPAGENDNAPQFFSGNMTSLSNTFRDLDSETFTESLAPDNVIHQTVVYQWHR